MINRTNSMSLSPRGTDILSLDDGFVETKRVTTFGVLTRRFTTTFVPRSNEDIGKNQSHVDDSFRRIKLQILSYNPMIYEMFRESLVDKFYTDLTVCYMLNRFLDDVLRLPDMRNDISNHRLAYSTHRPRISNTTMGLFAYLTGDSSSPTSQEKPIAVARYEFAGNSPKVATISCCELSLPSLDFSVNTSEQSDDELHGFHESAI
jgi:hypothetical protein